MFKKVPPLIQDYLTAYNAMDVDGMLAVLTDDVVFKHRVGKELTAEADGKAAFEEMARFAVTAFKERTITVKTAFSLGPTTVLTVQFDAVVATDLPNGWKAGDTVKLRGASEFQLQDGKIARITDQL